MIIDARCLSETQAWPMSTVTWNSYPWSQVSQVGCPDQDLVTTLPLSSPESQDTDHLGLLQRHDSTFDDIKEVNA